MPSVEEYMKPLVSQMKYAIFMPEESCNWPILRSLIMLDWCKGHIWIKFYITVKVSLSSSTQGILNSKYKVAGRQWLRLSCHAQSSCTLKLPLLSIANHNPQLSIQLVLCLQLLKVMPPKHHPLHHCQTPSRIREVISLGGNVTDQSP